MLPIGGWLERDFTGERMSYERGHYDGMSEVQELVAKLLREMAPANDDLSVGIAVGFCVVKDYIAAELQRYLRELTDEQLFEGLTVVGSAH